MIRVKKSFLFLVLLVSLIACSQQPNVSTSSPSPSETFTPYVGGTETALASEVASPTAWVAGTETALSIASASPTGWVPGTETAIAALSQTPTLVPTLPPLSTFTPVPTLPPMFPSTFVPLPEGTFSPVFYGRGPFLLVGGIKTDQGWLSGVDSAQYVSNETAYDFFGPSGFFQVPGSAPEFSPVCQSYSMHSSVVLPEPMVGVASGWLSGNQGVKNLSTDDPTYIQAVREWFQSQGNSPAQIQITRIFQADLEDDGVNEVLLSVSYFKDSSGHMAENGDYSIVLIRKVVGNDILTIPLVKDYYVTSLPQSELTYPLTYTLAGALDLNRDGTLEVLVDVSRWEGGGLIVYRVDGQNVREVLRTIC
jgi:hypothetical protein